MKRISIALAILVLGTSLGFAIDIPMQPVESTFIECIGYDEATQTLALQMRNCLDVYHYLNVPETVFDEFLKAGSKGGFFVENVKDKFEHKVK